MYIASTIIPCIIFSINYHLYKLRSIYIERKISVRVCGLKLLQFIYFSYRSNNWIKYFTFTPVAIYY